MNYANPSFPTNVGPANIGPMANIAPMANAPAYTAGYHHHLHHHPYPVHGAFTSSGVILVLFILLVIISRSWGGL